MIVRYLLDTDIMIYVLRGRPPEFRKRLERIPFAQLGISAITAAELLAGIQGYDEHHRYRLATESLLRRMTVFPWDEAAAPIYADIQTHLSRTGQMIGEMDTLIAAHALALGLPLITGNVRHHARVPGLTVIDWREPAD